MFGKYKLRIFWTILTFSLVSLSCTLADLIEGTDFTNLIVTKTEDTNDGSCTKKDCSLREAVIAANKIPGHNVIVIPAGIYPLTIHEAADYPGRASEGDLDILDEVTIRGAGSEATFIDGNSNHRVFDIERGVGTVEILALTIQHGDAGAGGGINIEPDARVEIAEVTLRENTATTGIAKGGGIYNEGLLTLNHVTILNNRANRGGGIFSANGTITLEFQSLVLGNEASSGGGIYNEGGTVSMRGQTVISSNSAVWGGGITNTGEKAELSIEASEIVSNGGGSIDIGVGGGILNEQEASTILESVYIANNEGGVCGGGIYNDRGYLSIMNSALVRNTSLEGAGLCSSFVGVAWVTDIEMVNVTFSENTAAEEGGGLLINRGIYRLTNLTIAGNQASAGGGLYLVDGTIYVKNTIVANNTGGNCAGVSSGSLGHNLESMDTCGFVQPGDLINTDPLIGPLQEMNSTFIHPLLTGSLAIDSAGGTDCPATDQRGVARPQGAACDIGAYEAEAPLVLTVVPLPKTINTSTMTAPMVTGGVNVNCRRGPSTVFEVDGTLLKGESAPVVGRTDDVGSPTWVQVELPNNIVCWVWTGNTMISGNLTLVPVVSVPTPPPPESDPTSPPFIKIKPTLKPPPTPTPIP